MCERELTPVTPLSLTSADAFQNAMHIEISPTPSNADRKSQTSQSLKLFSILKCSVVASRTLMDLGRRNELRSSADTTLSSLLNVGLRPSLSIARHTAPLPRNKDADPATKLIVDAHLGSREGVQKAADSIVAAGRYVADVRDGSGNTALHRAAEQGHRDTCIVLFQRGLSPSIKSWISGDTPVHEAARNGKKETLQALLSREPSAAMVSNRVGAYPIAVAQQNGHIDCVKLLTAVMDCAVAEKALPLGKDEPHGHTASPAPLRVPSTNSDSRADQVDFVPKQLVRLPCQKRRVFSISSLEAVGGRSALEQMVSDACDRFVCQWSPAPCFEATRRKMVSQESPTNVRIVRWALTIAEAPSQANAQNISRAEAAKTLREIVTRLDSEMQSAGGFRLHCTADTLPEYSVVGVDTAALAGGGGTARNYGLCTYSFVLTIQRYVFNTIHSYVYCDAYRSVLSNVMIDVRDRFGGSNSLDVSQKQRALFHETAHRETCQRLDNSEEFCYVLESPLEQLCVAFPDVLVSLGVHQVDDTVWLEARHNDATRLEIFLSKLSELIWCSNKDDAPPSANIVASTESSLRQQPSLTLLDELPPPLNTPGVTLDIAAAPVTAAEVTGQMVVDARKKVAASRSTLQTMQEGRNYAPTVAVGVPVRPSIPSTNPGTNFRSTPPQQQQQMPMSASQQIPMSASQQYTSAVAPQPYSYSAPQGYPQVLPHHTPQVFKPQQAMPQFQMAHQQQIQIQHHGFQQHPQQQQQQFSSSSVNYGLSVGQRPMATSVHVSYPQNQQATHTPPVQQHFSAFHHQGIAQPQVQLPMQQVQQGQAPMQQMQQGQAQIFQRNDLRPVSQLQPQQSLPQHFDAQRVHSYSTQTYVQQVYQPQPQSAYNQAHSYHQAQDRSWPLQVMPQAQEAPHGVGNGMSQDEYQRVSDMLSEILQQ